MKRKIGFTLVEGVIALAVLGVVLAALFLFIRGTQRATDATAREAAAEEVRMAASRLEVLLANTGYMGEVFPDVWLPVIHAGEDRLTIVANLVETQRFGPEDTLTITTTGGMVTVHDASGADFIHPFPGRIAFSYFDASGAEVTEPGQVRRIDYAIASARGSEASGSVAPYNLAVANDPQMLRALFDSYGDDGRGSRFERDVFYEDFEVQSAFAFHDIMEASWIWVPYITEDFEDPISWNNNWQTWTENTSGRIRRWTSSEAYEGNSCLALDCGIPGSSTQLAIWSVDLSDTTIGEFNLNYWWRKSPGDPVMYEDGVFLPQWVPDSQTQILSEDFSGFRQGFPRNWTFWTDNYGRVEVTDRWPHPSDGGHYLNLDTRRQGYAGTGRVMVTLDLSAFAGSSELELSFDMCNRGSPNSAFVGIMGSGGITSAPLAVHQLNPGAYPAGSWTTVTIDLDELIPVGYDLSNTRIVIAQQGTGTTAGSTYHGGISIDNVLVSEGTEGHWDLSRKISVTNPATSWSEVNINLTQAAQTHGVPLTNNFLIGFAQNGAQPIPNHGITYDLISVQTMNWGMPGWTHGPWPGYVTDEWVPSNHAAHSGSWCFATAGNGNYTQTPTRAWLQSPVIDLTSYPVGQRVAVAFFHRYSFGLTGDGCNVKISANNGQTWQLIVPYWGYYTAAVPALDMEPGWTGATGSGHWNFSVIDITEYAGQQVRLRFNYGTLGNASNPGWEVDYTRSRPGADWPQIIWGMTTYAMADWFAYATAPGGQTWDPTSTPNGSRWAGNDMSTAWSPHGFYWNLRYEINQHNALITPPIFYNNDMGDNYAYVEFYGSPRFELNYDFGYLEVARFSEIAPHQFSDWHPLVTLHGEAANWGHFRYRVDWLPPDVFGPNRTVVFRWRMTSDGSINRGGWNIDRLRFFSSDQYLPDLFYQPIGGVATVGSIEDFTAETPEGSGAHPSGSQTPVVFPVQTQHQEVLR